MTQPEDAPDLSVLLDMASLHGDLALLSVVIEAGGFTRASLASGMTKSRISRPIAPLEGRLGVRLVDRGSRWFNPTPIGLELARDGDSIRLESEAALQLTHHALRKPRGRLRMACQGALTTLVVGSFCVDFAQRNPDVLVTMDTMDGVRFPANDGYDIILQITRNELPASEVIARRLVDIGYEIVAAPERIEACGSIGDVTIWPGARLSFGGTSRCRPNGFWKRRSGARSRCRWSRGWWRTTCSLPARLRSAVSVWRGCRHG